MSSFKKNLVALSKIVAIGLIVGVFTSYALADWAEPPANPPSGNTAPPINISNIGQIKTGGLTLNTGGAATGLSVPDGDVKFDLPNKIAFFGLATEATSTSNHNLRVFGNVNADFYCDRGGANCYTSAEMFGGGGGGLDEKVKGSSVDPTPGYLTAKVNNSITVISNKLSLVGDILTPGNNKCYGSSNTGVKGWYTCDIDGNAGGGGFLAVKEFDGAPSISSVTSLEFDQADGFVVSTPGAGRAKINFTGGGGSLDEKVKVSSADTTAGYLNAKIRYSIAASGNFIQLLNDVSAPGNNKCYGTSATGVRGWFNCNVDTLFNQGGGADEKVKASATDATAGFLDTKVSNSVTVTANKIALVGDSASPGNSKYYGTNSSGTRGWHGFPGGIYAKSASGSTVNVYCDPGDAATGGGPINENQGDVHSTHPIKAGGVAPANYEMATGWHCKTENSDPCYVMCMDLNTSPNPVPTVNLTANPLQVSNCGLWYQGNCSSVLTWTSTGADSCVASGGWGGSKGPNGSQNVSWTGTADQTFTLTCTGPGGSGSDSVIVVHN